MKTNQASILPRLLGALWFASLAPGVKSSAQTVAPAAPATSNQVVALSEFDVVDSTDDSYAVDSATAGLKTRQPLIDIAGAVEVMPRAVIDDLGFDWLTTDYARYVSSGLNSYGANNQLYLRGQKETWMFKDGLQYYPSVDDDFAVETVEVVKGVNSTLFGSLPAVSGMVLLTSKVPLPVQQDSIEVTGDTNGGVLRSELDSTGPLSADFLGAKLSYRLLLGGQDGNMQQIYNDDRTLASLSFQLDWKQATLRVRYENTIIEDFGLYTNNFLDQNDEVSTIGGRNEAYKAPWARSRFNKSEFEVNLENRYTSNIESKLQLAYFQELRTDHDNRAYLVAAPGDTSLNGNVVIPVTPQSILASTVLQLAETQWTMAVNDDYIATYPIGNTNQQTNWGFSAEQLYNSEGLIQPFLGYYSVINPVFSPDPGQIAIPGSDDTISVSTVADAYVQQQAKFFSDRLILTAGLDWGYNEEVSHTAVAAPTYLQSTGSAVTYKLAALYKLTPQLSLYTSRATAFVPQSPGIVGQNGQPLPAVSSTDEELGLKTNGLLNGIVTGSAGVYSSSTLNQSVAVNAGTAGGYYANSGRTDTRGLEFDLDLKPIPGWEVVGTVFNGNGVWSSATSAYANRTYKVSDSALAKYNFSSVSPLKGLSIGANAFHMGQVYILPVPSYPAWTIYGLFADYRVGPVLLGLNLDNLTNAVYDSGGNNRYQVAIGQPRTLSFSVKYHF